MAYLGEFLWNYQQHDNYSSGPERDNCTLLESLPLDDPKVDLLIIYLTILTRLIV